MPPINQLHRDELHTTRQNLSDEHTLLDRLPSPTEQDNICLALTTIK